MNSIQEELVAVCKKRQKSRVLARDFINHSDFRTACANAGIQPTTRQARRFQSKRGLAYRVMKGV
jgi:hypothetical protein